MQQQKPWWNPFHKTAATLETPETLHMDGV